MSSVFSTVYSHFPASHGISFAYFPFSGISIFVHPVVCHLFSSSTLQTSIKDSHMACSSRICGRRSIYWYSLICAKVCLMLLPMDFGLCRGGICLVQSFFCVELPMVLTLCSWFWWIQLQVIPWRKFLANMQQEWWELEQSDGQLNWLQTTLWKYLWLRKHILFVSQRLFGTFSARYWALNVAQLTKNQIFRVSSRRSCLSSTYNVHRSGSPADLSYYFHLYFSGTGILHNFGMRRAIMGTVGLIHGGCLMFCLGIHVLPAACPEYSWRHFMPIAAYSSW